MAIRVIFNDLLTILAYRSADCAALCLAILINKDLGWDLI
jgi:hypothetical protein